MTHLSLIGKLALLLVVTSFLTALPPNRASALPQRPAAAGATVTLTVLMPDSTSANQAMVGYSPWNANTSFDHAQAQYGWTTSGGNVIFNDVQPGTYAVKIDPPQNASSAIRLIDTFTVVDTNPFSQAFTLPWAPKHIIGSVKLNDVGQENVWVYAYNPDTSDTIYSLTNSSGNFDIGVFGGKWRVDLNYPSDAQWVYPGSSVDVYLANDSAAETQQVDFILTPTDGYLTGVVHAPDGSPLPLPSGETGPTNQWAYIMVQTEDSYRYSPLSASGTYSVPVLTGQYQISVWLNQNSYPDYFIPPATLASIVTGTVTLEPINLQQRSATISGNVTQTGGGVAGVGVYAIGQDSSYLYTTTGATGSYTLKVPSGDWYVVLDIPLEISAVDQDYSQQVIVGEGETATANFDLVAAAAQLRVSLVDNNSASVGYLEGWAYARDASSGAYLASTYVYSNGFTLNVPSGDMRVGFSLASGSKYSLLSEVNASTLALSATQFAAAQIPVAQLTTAQIDAQRYAPYEQALTVAAPGNNLEVAVQSLQMKFVRNDAKLHGIVRDHAGQPMINISGVIYATPQSENGSWQYAYINADDGSYDLTLAAGTWDLSYYLDLDLATYSPYSQEPISVTVASGNNPDLDIRPAYLDGVISGELRNEQDQILPNEFIWVSNDTYSDYQITDENGAFIFYVPLDPGATPTTYLLGATLSCDIDTLCYLDPEPQEVTATPHNGTTALAGVAVTTVKAVRSGKNVKLSGSVSVNNDPKLMNATVKGQLISPNGRTSGGVKAVNGKFSGLLVPISGNQPTVKIRITATYGSYKGSKEVSVQINSTSGAILAGDVDIQDSSFDVAPVQGLPESFTDTFAAASNWKVTLSDGASISIPANAVPLSSSEKNVRIVIEPRIDLPADSLFEEANPYGYSISLYEANSGKAITAPLRTPAQLTLRYTPANLQENGAALANVRPANYALNRWTQTGSYKLDSDAREFIVETRDLGTWALMQLVNGTYTIYLPMVVR